MQRLSITIMLLFMFFCGYSQSKKELNQTILQLKNDSVSLATALQKTKTKVLRIENSIERLRKEIETKNNNHLKLQVSYDSLLQINLNLKKQQVDFNKKRMSQIDSLLNIIKFNKESEYKVQRFGGNGSGWLTIAITNNKNITILTYANENEYHNSGIPFYILQGLIGEPIGANGETINPNNALVNFNVLWIQPGKDDHLPEKNTIYYFSNKSGKDVIGRRGYEDSYEEQTAN